MYPQIEFTFTFIQKDPFVGNGVTKTPSNEYGTIEYNAFKPCEIEDGAAIYELKRGMPEKLAAVRVFDDDKYVWKVVK